MSLCKPRCNVFVLTLYYLHNVFPCSPFFNIWNNELMKLTNKWYWIEIIAVSPQVIFSAAGDVAQQTYIFKNIIWATVLYLLCRYYLEQKTLHGLRDPFDIYIYITVSRVTINIVCIFLGFDDRASQYIYLSN